MLELQITQTRHPKRVVDGQTNGRTNKRTDRRTDGVDPRLDLLSLKRRR